MLEQPWPEWREDLLGPEETKQVVVQVNNPLL